MAFWEVVLAWAGVACLFLAWELVSARLGRAGNAGGWFRAPVQVYVAEAALFTLLATLWFASIGSGTWPLVFFLIGALMEWPGPVRHGIRSPDGSGNAIRRLASGIARAMAGAAVVWGVLGGR